MFVENDCVKKGWLLKHEQKNRIFTVICNLFRNYHIMIMMMMMMMMMMMVTITMTMIIMLIIIPLFTLEIIYSTDASGLKQTNAFNKRIL